jgi:hypothetical protein
MMLFLKRLLLGIGALVLLLSSLVLGLLLTLVVVPWALLRGRRPGPVRFSWHSTQRAPGWGRPGGFRHTPAQGDVVDVEARELPSPPPRRVD